MELAKTAGMQDASYILLPDRNFHSVRAYNALLKSKTTYEAFSNFTYIIIVQPDAIVFRDDLSFWVEQGYSYVGAPVFKGFSNPIFPLSFTGILNGGLSLRKVEDFLSVLDRCAFINIIDNAPGKRIWGFVASHITSKILNKKFVYDKFRKNEDDFWSIEAPTILDNFSICPSELALNFGFETLPSKMFSMNKCSLPMGAHAWERYNDGLWDFIYTDWL